MSHQLHWGIQGKSPTSLLLADLPVRFLIFFFCGFCGCGFFCFGFAGRLAIVFFLSYSIISASEAELNPA
jgi:hypothetical protein